MTPPPAAQQGEPDPSEKPATRTDLLNFIEFMDRSGGNLRYARRALRLQWEAEDAT